jgi:hypothetical protein
LPKQLRATTRASRPRAAARQQTSRQSAGTAAPKGSAPKAAAVPLSLVLPGGVVLPLDWPDIAREAMVQGYKVRNRRRWTAEDETDTLGDSSLTEVLDLPALQQIAKAGIVEVSVPWSDEEGDAWGWPARIMPWEFVLSRATRPYRDKPLTVIRRVELGAARRTARGLFDSVMLVESAPSALNEMYDLTQETRLVRGSLGLPDNDARVHVLSQPDDRRLREAVTEFTPSLVHWAGFDTHQAASLLPRPDRGDPTSTSSDRRRDPSTLDGVAICGPGRDPMYVAAEWLAQLLVPQTRPPTLVSLNVYNSAARIAPRLVVAGAAHAVGFQDTIDDRLAEQFFSSFYRALSDNPADVLGAFRTALGVLRDTPKRLSGACVVLWSAQSLLTAATPASIDRRPRTSTRFKVATTAPARDQIEVICEPRDEMNYSLLHNGRSPFGRFQILRRQVSGPIADVTASVTMYVGEESFPFVKTLTIAEGDTMADITDQVVVPLTSALMRTQSEKVRSVLAVKVAVGDQVVHNETYRMALAPVDQWSDTDENRLWLPSFVLPRDPSVASLVQSARNYLISIEDDPSAGFDGYQSVGEAGLPFDERYRSVDDQVRAIWYALQLDRRLLYINPPPSYASPNGGDAPQRLRTPSEILQGGHGTCIDLALLLCACLEYIDIWPVVFLLEGHAFPGYWRSDALHDGFQHFANLDEVQGAQLRTGAVSDRLEASYTLPKSAYLELMSVVQRGNLVPLEAVWLTNGSSFSDAQSEGAGNLRSPREFQSVVDIHRARDEGIAPLPIMWRGK